MSDSLNTKDCHGEAARARLSLKTRHGELDLSRRTALMGVLNVTPDSFSDGGKFFDPGRAVARGLELAAEGADIIDIGGESTRPGSEPVPAAEEIGRVVPVIRALRRQVALPISIDTYKAEVARRALAEGADIVNDVSALRFDSGMAPLVAAEKVPVILMHMQGTPRTMQLSPSYRNVVSEVADFLRARARAAAEAGIDPGAIVIDPGIGFGKTLEHNLALLRRTRVFTRLGFPLLVGVSRKAFIGRILDAGPEDRLEGSLAAAAAAVLGGAHIIRAHDARATARALRVLDAIRRAPVT
ncbi:MAG TPA: dihydropteroate synthase [Candidatus Acidoferrales bacterium]|nr:dihydropteroate synthase [Candidatus Acidoferrales bacterium]